MNKTRIKIGTVSLSSSLVIFETHTPRTFEAFFAVCIISNAVFLGVEVEYFVAHPAPGEGEELARQDKTSKCLKESKWSKCPQPIHFERLGTTR